MLHLEGRFSVLTKQPDPELAKTPDIPEASHLVHSKVLQRKNNNSKQLIFIVFYDQ